MNKGFVVAAVTYDTDIGSLLQQLSELAQLFESCIRIPLVLRCRHNPNDILIMSV
jgi:hypothetical protein